MTTFGGAATPVSSSSAVTSFPITIPAGVAATSVVFVVITAFGTSGAAEVIQASSTGTALTPIGATQNVPFSGFNQNGRLFWFVASASDAGKVITASLASSDTAKWAIGLVWYTAASNAAPIDVSGVAVNSGLGSSITCPSETTGVAGDWDLQIVSAALSGSAFTGGAGFTSRTSLSDASSGATVIMYDSNGPVGGIGTGIGGAVFSNAGHNSWWIGWTVGLAPAGVPHTATASLTVTLSFAVTTAQGHVRTAALTVTPQFRAVPSGGVVLAGSGTILPLMAAMGSV